MASLLANIVEERQYKTASRHVRWSVDAESSRMVSEKWIKLLWTFVHTEIDRLNEENEFHGEELKVSTSEFMRLWYQNTYTHLMRPEKTHVKFLCILIQLYIISVVCCIAIVKLYRALKLKYGRYVRELT